MKTIRQTSKQRTLIRLQTIRDEVLRIAEAFGVRDIAAEFFMPRRASATGAIKTLWLHGLIHVGLAERGFPAPLVISPATLKKWWTDSGKADKDDMADAAFEKFGEEFEDDNACDAFLLAQLARIWNEWNDGESDDFTKYQKEKMRAWLRYL